MAQVDFKLVVGADTSEARAELDAIERRAQAVKDAKAESEQRPGTPSATPVPAAGKPGAKPAQDFGRNAGEVAGRAIGKAVAGFLVHDVASQMFSSMRTVGGDNRAIDRAEGAVGGAVKYGTMGAMIGGPLGAAIGGIAGAISGLAGQLNREKTEKQTADLATRVADHNRTIQGGVAMADRAFGEELSLEGNWRRRVGMMAERAGDIQGGDGSWSIRNLEKALKNLTPGTAQYDQVAKNLEMQKNRAASLQQQMFEEALPWRPRMMEAGEVADSFSKRGLEVGAQADVASVTDRMLDELRAIRQDLHAVASRGADEVHTPESLLRRIGAFE